MGNLLLAAAIVFGGWWLLRRVGSSQPDQLRKLIRKVAGAAIGLAGALLTVRGASNVGLPLVMLGLGLFGETTLFPKGFPWPGGAHPPGGPAGSQQQRPPPPRGATMSRAEAFDVLGLKGRISADDVNAAYRRLMKDYHPDRGGSDYLAAKINEARQILLHELGETT